MNAGRCNRARAGVAALIAGLLASPIALADASMLDTETVTRTIDVSGFDLSSPAGAQHVYKQIAVTAKTICEGTGRTFKGVARAKQRAQARRCFDAAVERALAEVTDSTGIDLEQVAGADGSREVDLVARR